MQVFNPLKCKSDDFATVESDQILTTSVGLRVAIVLPAGSPPVVEQVCDDYSVLIDFNGNVLTEAS